MTQSTFPSDQDLGVWYRYENFRWAAPLDEWDNPMGPGTPDIRLIECRVLKVTPKGVWLDTRFGDRFVRLNANKRYACPTKAEALESFIQRKRRQIRILSRQLEDAEIAIQLAKRELEPEKCPHPMSLARL